MGTESYPGIVHNLFPTETVPPFSTIDNGGSWWIVPFRSFYFSIVTMTTLGFGDMYAKPNLIGYFF
ncbi:MAG: hypothetical protein GY730_00030 [bacterium]|nr:hypothetical protein [bacterium]